MRAAKSGTRILLWTGREVRAQRRDARERCRGAAHGHIVELAQAQLTQLHVTAISTGRPVPTVRMRACKDARTHGAHMRMR